MRGWVGIVIELKIKVVSRNLGSADVGLSRQRLNETILKMFKESEENIVLQVVQVRNVSRKINQMDLVELEKYSNRNKKFTGGYQWIRDERRKSQCI